MPLGATFRPFDPNADLRIYVRSLPHWRQRGATYFVTFRQDDSIPAAVLAEWLDIREHWYRAHGLDPRWKVSAPERFDAVYCDIPEEVRRAFERERPRMLHEELDRCHGSCVLRQDDVRQHLINSLAFFHGQRLWMGDYVVMPNHTHAIIQPFHGWELEDLLGSVKKHTSRRIGEWLTLQSSTVQLRGPVHSRPRFWQYESYDHIVRDAEELAIFRRYIAGNPMSAKLRTDEYFYYAANWLDSFAERPRLPV